MKILVFIFCLIIQLYPEVIFKTRIYNQYHNFIKLGKFKNIIDFSNQCIAFKPEEKKLYFYDFKKKKTIFSLKYLDEFTYSFTGKDNKTYYLFNNTKGKDKRHFILSKYKTNMALDYSFTHDFKNGYVADLSDTETNIEECIKKITEYTIESFREREARIGSRELAYDMCSGAMFGEPWEFTGERKKGIEKLEKLCESCKKKNLDFGYNKKLDKFTCFPKQEIDFSKYRFINSGINEI